MELLNQLSELKTADEVFQFLDKNFEWKHPKAQSAFWTNKKLKGIEIHYDRYRVVVYSRYISFNSTINFH